MSRPTIQEFNPNASTIGMWGLYDGYEFVTRLQRGPILTKLSNAGLATLWQLTNHGWVEVLRREKYPTVCESCGYRDFTVSWCLNRASGKITKELSQKALCGTCNRTENY